MWQQPRGAFGAFGTYGAAPQPQANPCVSMCCSLLFGFFFLLGSSALLFWNEGIAVISAKSLAEGMQAVRSLDLVTANRDIAALDGQLVHLTAPLQASTVVDAEFGISVPAVKLTRTVKMYQWVERSRDIEHKEYDRYGNYQVVTEKQYYHQLEWSSSVHKMEDFHSPNPRLGYNQGRDSTGGDGLYPPNPHDMQYKSVTFRPKSNKIGEFDLANSLVDKLDVGDRLDLAADSVKKLPQDFFVVNGRMQTYAGRSYPKVGDLVIEYNVVQPQTVSVVAAVQRGKLIPYDSRAGDTLTMLTAGVRSAEDMFSDEQEWLNIRTWGLRLLGWFLMFLSFAMILSPISTFFGLIPLIGSLLQSIAGAGVVIAAFALSISVSVLLCAVAWLWYRPMVSLALVACALVPLILAPKQRAPRERSQ